MGLFVLDHPMVCTVEFFFPQYRMYLQQSLGPRPFFSLALSPPCTRKSPEALGFRMI